MNGWSNNVAQYFGLARVGQNWGIEIEVEGGNVRIPPPAGWSFHEENSLRNGGAEFVTTTPIHFDQIEEQVTSLHRQLLNGRARINDASHRAGVHIHRNFTHYQLLVPFLTMGVYYCYEPFMLKMLGQQRNGNLFCLPSYDIGDQNDWFTRVVNCLFHSGYDWPERGRYASVNADSIRRLGSLEWRVFPFTLEGKKIRTWAGWIENFVHDGLNLYDSKQFVRYIKDIQQDPLGHLIRIFEQDGASAISLFGTDLSERLANYGVEQAYEYFRPLQKEINLVMKMSSDRKENRRKFKNEKPTPPNPPTTVFTTDDVVPIDPPTAPLSAFERARRQLRDIQLRQNSEEVFGLNPAFNINFDLEDEPPR